jgi:hypothetical protein
VVRKLIHARQCWWAVSHLPESSGPHNAVLVSFDMLDQGLRAFRAVEAAAAHDPSALSVVVRAVPTIGETPKTASVAR